MALKENLSSLQRWHKLLAMALHQLFFYLTIILLPTQLGLHVWPDWALVLGRRIDYLSPTLFLTDITIIMTILLWICSPHRITKRSIVIYACILIYMGMNIFFSVSPYVTFFRWIKVIEFGLFGYYIVKTKPSLSKTVFVLSIPMMYSSIITIAQFIFQRSIGGALWFLGERTFTISTPGISRVDWCWPTSASCIELLRPYGTFPHPNVLAGFLVITMCVVLWQLLSRQAHTTRIYVWFWVTIILGVIALGLTFSRGIWLIAIIAIVTIISTQYKKGLTHMTLWILLISSGCIIIAFPYFLSLLQQNESVIVRNELSRTALLMWKSYPLLGVGLNAFLVRLPTVFSSSPTLYLQPAHTIYLLLLSELGIIGVGGIGLFIYMLISKLRQLPNKLPLLLLIIYGLLGTIDHYPVTLQQGQLLTTIVLTIGFLSR